MVRWRSAVIWIVITRQRVRSDGHGGFVYGVGRREGTVCAPNAIVALERARIGRGPPLSVMVKSLVSWECSSKKEQAAILGDFTPPEETAEFKKARRLAKLQQQEGRV